MTNIVYNTDCMLGLKKYPDRYFHWAIVDPPYGIGAADDDRFGVKFKTAAAARKDYDKKDWDSAVPDEKYFKELKRVSRNQIIWGVNYYPYDFTGGRIFWDKDVPPTYTKSKGELAYVSSRRGVDYVKITWNGMLQQNMKDKEIRIHPTQKPVSLYKWILHNYCEYGDLILDTHVGSGSSRIACHEMGVDFIGFEIDKDYFEAQEKRFYNATRQEELFSEEDLNYFRASG